jgi:hypothetical protein
MTPIQLRFHLQTEFGRLLWGLGLTCVACNDGVLAKHNAKTDANHTGWNLYIPIKDLGQAACESVTKPAHKMPEQCANKLLKK